MRSVETRTNDKIKVLFVMRTVAHFTYHESTIRWLCGGGHRVEVLYDRELSNGDSDTVAQSCAVSLPDLTLGLSMRRRGLLRKPLFAARELHSYSSYLNREDQAEFYLKRWQRYLPKGTRRILAGSSVARRLLASSMAQSTLRAFERVVPSDQAIKRSLEQSKPDVVVASPINMRHSEELEYVKAAKSLGIPTVVPVLSWDNLTTKGLFHVIPDVTLVWNQTQADEAVSIHRVPRGGTVITGAPFLDKWFEESTPTLDESTFREKLGLDPGGAFVLYLGSSANIARDESWLLLKLAESLMASEEERLRRVVILARPHGANQGVFRGISAPNIRVWLRDRELPDSPESFAEFAASLRYSVCAVGLNTTGMVDALLADRPVIALLVDEYRNTNASRAVHFRYLLDADVYMRAGTPDRCAELIGEMLQGGDPKRDARRQFTIDFVRPRGFDRPAGEVAARAIEMAAQRLTATQISARTA